MKDDIKNIDENISLKDKAALDAVVKEIAKEVGQEIIIEGEVAAGMPANPNKITPGRKMRDSASAAANPKGVRPDSRGRGARGQSRGGEPRERVKPEFDAKMIDIRRVTRVTSGGRRMNFSVAVVAGDRKGRVGVGLGKAIDTSLAIEKATREAKKHLIKVPLSAQMTIPHAIESKFASARIHMFPARGRGVVAGSAARTVIELAGIKDICVKIMSGSKNKINIAKATIDALNKLSKIPRSTFVPKK